MRNPKEIERAIALLEELMAGAPADDLMAAAVRSYGKPLVNALKWTLGEPYGISFSEMLDTLERNLKEARRASKAGSN